MIKRNDKCEYCGGEMTAASIRKRFCSAKCRVYSKREKLYAEKYSEKTEPKIEVISSKIIKDEGKSVAIFNLEVEENVVKLPSEEQNKWKLKTPVMKVPPNLKGIARDAWIADFKKANRINNK